jgi:hypothetical protein
MPNLSMDKVASISHDMSIHRTMFIKPIMSHSHTQSACKGKRENQSVPTCHHCGIIGHVRPDCFQLRSQKRCNKTLVPRKDEPGFVEHVKMLSDQVKLITEKLAYVTPNERRSVLVNNQKASKQFYDNDLVVQFSKKECNIFDSSGKWLMGGERTADNCYGLFGLTTDP